jgi:hypothetical protein
MDFMFEDEVDEVGSDVEAYCPKCKADTTHVVISKYEDEIRRVQCNPCGDVHSFRKPRGEVEDDVPEPIAAKKRAMMKKLTFEEFFAKHSDKNAKPYEFREHYHENVIVTHPKFGTGFVSEILSDSKAEITFKDSRRVLVHNRKDMPGLPLAAEGDGHPSDTKISKLVKVTNGKAKVGKDAAPNGKSDAKSDPKAEAKPDAKSNGKGQTKPEAKSEAKSEAKPSPKNGHVRASKPASAERSSAPAKSAPATKAVKRTVSAARSLRAGPVKRTPAKGATKPSGKAAKRGKK